MFLDLCLFLFSLAALCKFCRASVSRRRRQRLRVAVALAQDELFQLLVARLVSISAMMRLNPLRQLLSVAESHVVAPVRPH